MTIQEILIPIAIILPLLLFLLSLAVLEGWKIRKLHVERDKILSCIKSNGPGSQTADIFVAYNRNLARYGIRVKDSFKGYFKNDDF